MSTEPLDLDAIRRRYGVACVAADVSTDQPELHASLDDVEPMLAEVAALREQLAAAERDIRLLTAARDACRKAMRDLGEKHDRLAATVEQVRALDIDTSTTEGARAWHRLCVKAFENLPADTIVTFEDIDAILTWCRPDIARALADAPPVDAGTSEAGSAGSVELSRVRGYILRDGDGVERAYHPSEVRIVLDDAPTAHDATGEAP